MLFIIIKYNKNKIYLMEEKVAYIGLKTPTEGHRSLISPRCRNVNLRHVMSDDILPANKDQHSHYNTKMY